MKKLLVTLVLSAFSLGGMAIAQTTTPSTTNKKAPETISAKSSTKSSKSKMKRHAKKTTKAAAKTEAPANKPK